MTADSENSAGGLLTIDLAAIAANWRLLKSRADPAECAAVVKADAYGLGAAIVAPALAQAGCRSFFVATPDEGLALRRILPDSRIFVLNGLQLADPALFVAAQLIPLLVSLAEIGRWRAVAADSADARCGLHFDSGMARLGLPADEIDRLAAAPRLLAGLTIDLAMSHLACADEPAHPMNRTQLDRFRDILKGTSLPSGTPRSLAASSGIFLGPDYAFELVRPGAALYGIAPLNGNKNPMRQAIRLQGRILQVRRVDSGWTVGYGATHRFAGPARVAAVGVGYADGYLRSLGNRGSAFIGGRRVPVVGRVSMDLITLDVSGLAEAETRPGDLVDLIGPDNPVDALAAEAGTIGYEILTSLGSRYARRYVGADQGA